MDTSTTEPPWLADVAPAASLPGMEAERAMHEAAEDAFDHMREDAAKRGLVAIADAVRALGCDTRYGRVSLPCGAASVRAIVAAGGSYDVTLYRHPDGDYAIDGARIVVEGVAIEATGERRPATAEESERLSVSGRAWSPPAATASVTL